MSQPCSPMTISVVICAYTEDRWDQTLAAVASVLGQRFLPCEVLLVIDHNRRLYERLSIEFADSTGFGCLVRIIENAEAKGLSGGRNTGVAAARGDVVAFLDDDAVADPGWLDLLVEGYADERVLGVGGATYPDWQGEDGCRPAWFPPEFDWVVGCSHRGLPTRTAPVRNPFGGNCSFRRWVFAAVGGFTTGIGRDGNKRPLGGEETEFSIRLRHRYPDAVLLFEPAALIWHNVPASRSTWRYFWSRCYAEGLSKASIARHVGADDGLASERAYTSRVLPAAVGRGLLATLRGKPVGLARATAIVTGLAATMAGYAVGSATSFPAPASRSGGLGRLGGTCRPGSVVPLSAVEVPAARNRR